jgi:hypothetical protein
MDEITGTVERPLSRMAVGRCTGNMSAVSAPMPLSHMNSSPSPEDVGSYHKLGRRGILHKIEKHPE